jgi:hypothetical protein
MMCRLNCKTNEGEERPRTMDGERWYLGRESGFSNAAVLHRCHFSPISHCQKSSNLQCHIQTPTSPSTFSSSCLGRRRLNVLHSSPLSTNRNIKGHLNYFAMASNAGMSQYDTSSWCCAPSGALYPSTPTS